jgi:hypothetical protein
MKILFKVNAILRVFFPPVKRLRFGISAPDGREHTFTSKKRGEEICQPILPVKNKIYHIHVGMEN